MAVQNGKTCKEHATSYTTLIDAKARVYCQVLGIFDSYTKEASMKPQTRERRKGKVMITKSYIVQDSTGIKDNNTFLAITKDSLMLYLSHQLIRYCAVKVMTATLQEVMTNYECEAMPSASIHEEADTVMIHHAVEVASNGMNIHICSQETDVLLLALPRIPLLGDVSWTQAKDDAKSSYNLYMTRFARRNQEL